MTTQFTLDLSSLSEQTRIGMPAALTDRTEAFVRSRFPADSGYKCQRMTTKPFKERPHLLGYHINVRRGFLWGFDLRIMPDDFQTRQSTVKLVPQSRMNETAVGVAFLLGMLAGAGAAVVTYQHSQSDTGRNVVIAFFFGSFAVGGVIFGVLWLIAKAITKAFTDPDKDEREREALWKDILPLLRL